MKQWLCGRCGEDTVTEMEHKNRRRKKMETDKKLDNVDTSEILFNTMRKAIMPCLEPPKKIQKFKNSTVEKKNISLVQLTNAAISLLN